MFFKQPRSKWVLWRPRKNMIRSVLSGLRAGLASKRLPESNITPLWCYFEYSMCFLHRVLGVRFLGLPLVE